MQAAEINKKWSHLQEVIAKTFDTDIPDIKVMLFLIGVQELGKGAREFSKREKEELMHIATCRLFSSLGFYELPIPNYTLMEQEMIIKSLIIDYFEDVNVI